MFFLKPFSIDVTLSVPVIFAKQNAQGIESVFDRCLWPPDNSGNDIEPSMLSKLTDHDAGRYFYDNCFSIDKHNSNIELSDVNFINASKTDLKLFDDLFSFGERNYNLFRKGINKSEKEYFEYCIKAGLKEGYQRFEFQSWSEKPLIWINSGGSHRFSAAYFMAKKWVWAYEINAGIGYHSISDWIDKLLNYFNGYILSIGRNDFFEFRKCFDIYGDHATYIGLKNVSGDPESVPVLLLLDKKKPLKRGVQYWIDSNIWKGNILVFKWIVEQFKEQEKRLKQQFL